MAALADKSPAMSITEIQRMPRSEKLKLFEALWADLARDEDSLESPAWHRKELHKTEARFAAGKEEVLEWPAAKKELRKMFE